MKEGRRIVVYMLLAVTGQAQEFVDKSALFARVRAGGRFEETQWRRGADGALEMRYFADTGDEQFARFMPVVGDGDRTPMLLENCGVFGLVAMLGQGGGDLLATTDADFHFEAVGVATTDQELRQFLVLPASSFEGSRGRAEMLDRMLAIDVLRRRSCRPAIAELQVLASGSDVPEALRQRAIAAMTALNGEPPIPRRRLAAESLRLPAVCDVCVVIDHARLPDMGTWTAIGRRAASLHVVDNIEAAGGDLSTATCNGAQILCDAIGEMPFALVHRFGGARVDHSCLVLTASSGAKAPFGWTWQAAGAFEHERWTANGDAAALIRDGAVTVESGHACLTGSAERGSPRPELAEQLHLLRDTGAAITAIVPAESRVWSARATKALPPAECAELRISFGDPATVVMTVTVRDDADVERWTAAGTGLLAEAVVSFDRRYAAQREACAALRGLVAVVAKGKFEAQERTVSATIEVRGFDAAAFRAVVETMLPELVSR